MRAIWGYGSQARLLHMGDRRVRPGLWRAVSLNGEAVDRDRAAASGALEPVADWIAAHGEWFDRASQVLYVLGALAIALNLWRALGFSNLILRGARLLNLEFRERRRDLDQRATRLNHASPR